MLGIPSDGSVEFDGGRIHREMVPHNKALLGSVNSNILQYEAAKESLIELPDWFTDEFVTGTYSPDKVERAFETGDDVIKTVIKFDAA